MLPFRLVNKFLGHIREVDAVTHVVRCFEDDNIPNVANKVDPHSGIKVIHTDLMIADMETPDRRRVKIEKVAKSGNKEARFELGIVEQLSQVLNDGKPAHVATHFRR